MDVRTLVFVATSARVAVGCGSDLVSVDEAGSTTDPGGTGTETETETGTEPGTGDGDGDGDGDGEPEPVCGDGTLDPFELCDDGNRIDADGCESDCRPSACAFAWDVVDASPTLGGSMFDEMPLALRDDGSFVTAHAITVGPVINLRVRAWTGDGALLWEFLHSFATLRDTPQDLIADANGDLYLASVSNISTDGLAVVAKLSGEDGALIWQQQRDGLASGGSDRAAALAFDGSGRLLVAFEIVDDPTGANIVLAALDPDDGVEQWSASWSSPPGAGGLSRDRVGGMVVDPDDGAVYLITDSEGAVGVREQLLLRFDPPATEPTFELEAYADPSSPIEAGYARGLVLSEAGELVALISRDLGEQRFDFVIVGYDPETGAQTWERPSTDYGLGHGEVSLTCKGLLALPDGGLGVTGWGSKLTVDRQEAYLLRLDAERELACLGLRDDGGPAPLFGGMAVGEGGRTYVSGYIFSGQFRTVVTAWD